MGTLSVRRLLRRLSAGCRLCLAALLSAAPAAACSWDYLIWMPRHKDADPLYRFVRDGKAGYINREGKVVIEPRFKVFYSNYNGEFRHGLVQLGVSTGEFADATGKPVNFDDLYRVWEFSEGLAAALADDKGKWGYVDPAGKFVISPRFGDVSSFAEGLAAVEVAGRTGYVDRTGEFVVPPRFLVGKDFRDGMARVVVEGPCVYVDHEPCAEPTPVGGDGPDAGACRFTFADPGGRVLAARFDDAKDFSEGLAPVRVGDKWGFVDKTGAVVIEPRFEAAEPFAGGLAAVSLGGRFGYIERTGAFTIRPRFGRAEAFAEGFAVVCDTVRAAGDEYYYIDRRGRAAIPGRFAAASHFFKGLAHVKLGPKAGEGFMYAGDFAYIDATGKKVFTYTISEGD